MTRQVLFIQGAGENAHDRWDLKLAESLERELGAAYAVHYPRMPVEADPHYSAWKMSLFGVFASLQDGAMLVGHSAGGAILLHAWSERRPRLKPGGLFLVAAPFIGEGGWPSAEIQSRVDFSQALPAEVPVFLYYGAADEIVPVTHARLYAQAITQAVVRTCAHCNHQLNNDMSPVARDIRSVS